MFQIACEESKPYLNPKAPPRRWVNKHKGYGMMEYNHPPIIGVLGRKSEQISFTVCE